jgi:hypothetical protein
MIIADWLSTAYQFKIQLTGIVYLHRILDPRLGGAAMKNLRMFKKLCGDKGLGSVVLATTMWDGVPVLTGRDREADLKTRTDFWKYMIDQGAKMFRQDSGRDSAAKIIQYLINKNRPVILDIQRDLVDRNLTLNETAAGQEVVSKIEVQRALYEKKLDDLRKDIADALARNNQDRHEELEALKADWEEQASRDKEELVKLQVNREQLRREMEQQHEAEKAKIVEELERTKELIRQDEIVLSGLKDAYKKDLQLQEARLKNKFYQAMLAKTCCVM